jgi:hypothetical protein
MPKRKRMKCFEINIKLKQSPLSAPESISLSAMRDDLAACELGIKRGAL